MREYYYGGNREENVKALRESLAAIGPELVKKGMATFEDNGIQRNQGFGTCIVARMYGDAGTFSADYYAQSAIYDQFRFAEASFGAPSDALENISEAHYNEPELLKMLAEEFLAGQQA